MFGPRGDEAHQLGIGRESAKPSRLCDCGADQGRFSTAHPSGHAVICATRRDERPKVSVFRNIAAHLDRYATPDLRAKLLAIKRKARR